MITTRNIESFNITKHRKIISSDGAEIVRGLHLNKIISKITELQIAFGITHKTDIINNVKKGFTNYKTDFSASPVFFEDLKPLIDTINDIITMEELDVVPLDYNIIKDKNFKSANEANIIRGYDLLNIADKLNIIISVYNDVHIPRNSPGTEYWVRPIAGGPYGTADGSSYTNAFAGFGNIDTLQPGDVLHVRGTHLEYFLCGSLVNLGTDDNYITIDFGDNNDPDPGSIDGGGTILTGIQCNGRYNIAFNYPRVTNVTTDGVQCYNAAYNMLFRYGDFSVSGNQGTQLENTAKATFFKCTSYSNTDDGFSQHDSTEGKYYACTGHLNDQGINIVSSATAKIFRCNFYSNTTYDVYGTTDSVFNSYLSTYEKSVQLDGNAVFNDL